MLEGMVSSGGIAARSASWLHRHRREAIDLLALGLSFLLVRRLGVEVPLAGVVCAFAVAVLVPLRAAAPRPTLLSEALAGAPRVAAAVLVAGVILHFWLNRPLDFLWFGAAWPAVGGLLRLDWDGIARWTLERNWVRDPARGEVLRCSLLLLAALFLMVGFARSTLHGTPDAYWYSLNLADMVD